MAQSFIKICGKALLEKAHGKGKFGIVVKMVKYIPNGWR